MPVKLASWQALRFSRDGRRLVALSPNGEAQVWRTNGWASESRWKESWGYVWRTSLAFSGDGQELLLMGLEAAAAGRFDVQGRKTLPPLDVGVKVTALAVASDGSLAVGTIRGDVVLLNGAREERERLFARAWLYKYALL